MLISDGQLTLSNSEWALFQEVTFAPWRPRTRDEFNAMCKLGAIRHMIENTGGVGWMRALACEDIMFGENGEINFPQDKRRMAYLKVHGTWPSDAELADFESQSTASTRNVTQMHRE